MVLRRKVWIRRNRRCNWNSKRRLVWRRSVGGDTRLYRLVFWNYTGSFVSGQSVFRSELCRSSWIPRRNWTAYSHVRKDSSGKHRDRIKFNSIKIYRFFIRQYWHVNNFVVFYLLGKLKANLLKSRDAKPEGTKVRKFDHVSRLPLFPYHVWKRCETGRNSDNFYYYMDVWF